MDKDVFSEIRHLLKTQDSAIAQCEARLAELRARLAGACGKPARAPILRELDIETVRRSKLHAGVLSVRAVLKHAAKSEADFLQSWDAVTDGCPAARAVLRDIEGGEYEEVTCVPGVDGAPDRQPAGGDPCAEPAAISSVPTGGLPARL